MSENKKKKAEKSGFDTAVKKFSGRLKDIQGEFKKIIWPDKKELVKHTINVILVAGAIGAIIVVMDLAFSQGYTAFINLFS